MNNIIFFYPSKVVGGAELLFARIAKYLKETTDNNIYYIDYKDGFIRNNPDFQKLEFLDFNDNYKTKLNINGYLITPISNIYRISDYINFNNNESRLFFWCLHPHNLIHVMPEARTLEKYSEKQNKFILEHFCKNTFFKFNYLLDICNKNNSIYFMDESTYVYNKTIFQNSLEEKYLPVALGEKKLTKIPDVINDKEINIAILGRLCKEKTMPLINVIEELEKLETQLKKRVHIIGEGECKNLITSKKFKNVEIIFTSTLTGENLDKYLVDNVDIIFSMGTSCIEGSALKIPVIILPYSYKKVKNDKFYFFFESQKYNLGIDLNKYQKQANMKLDDIINLIYEEKQKSALGEKCYNYFIENHSLQFTSKKLLKILENDNLDINTYKQILIKIGKLSKNKNIIYKILRWFK